MRRTVHIHLPGKTADQNEKQARQANVVEWAKTLTDGELERLLGPDRSKRTPEEVKALVAEERRRGSSKDAALEGWRLDDVRRVAKEFANEGRTEGEFIAHVGTRYGVKTTAEQTIARQAFAAAKSGKTSDYRPGDLVKAKSGNIGEGVPGRVIRSYEERGRTFVEYQTKHGKQTSEEKDLERASTQDASFRLVDMDGHDWGTWSAGNVDDAIRLLRADVARRPKAYMGQPNYESIRKAVRMGGADSKDAASKVVARSKRGTVEEFIEGAGGAQPRTKYYARLSGGQNLGSFNSIENAKQAIESHGVQNATSGRQVTPLQWSSTDATAPLSFVISEVEHNGDESSSLDDLRKAGCTNILVTARNYENGVIRVSCTPPAGVTSKQQLQAKLSYAVLDAVNHLGEREYQTYNAWRAAAKAAGATSFEGNKDIASAFKTNVRGHAVSVGEWGGDVGVIYKTRDAAPSEIDSFYKRLRGMDKEQLIREFSSRLDKAHLASESKGDIINAILNQKFSRRDLDAWGK